MVEVYCRSNIDNVKCNVTQMVAIPRIGDWVECYVNHEPDILKICRIIHRIKKNNFTNQIPFLEIELTK
jgi:hypothetical protein